MQPGKAERKEEHGDKLRIDAFSYILLGHAHVYHNIITSAVLVALRKLFVINYKHGGGGEYDAQNHGKAEQRCEEAEIIVARVRAVVRVKLRIAFGFLPRIKVQLGKIPAYVPCKLSLGAAVQFRIETVLPDMDL